LIVNEQDDTNFDIKELVDFCLLLCIRTWNSKTGRSRYW